MKHHSGIMPIIALYGAIPLGGTASCLHNKNDAGIILGHGTAYQAKKPGQITAKPGSPSQVIDEERKLILAAEDLAKSDYELAKKCELEPDLVKESRQILDSYGPLLRRFEAIHAAGPDCKKMGLDGKSPDQCNSAYKVKSLLIIVEYDHLFGNQRKVSVKVVAEAAKKMRKYIEER